jgi:hypothetical protein
LMKLVSRFLGFTAAYTLSPTILIITVRISSTKFLVSI